MINLFLDLARFLLILYPAWAGLHRCNDVSRLEVVEVSVGGGQIGVAELLGDHHDVVALVQQVNRPRMAQSVGMDTLCKSGFLGQTLEQMAAIGCVDWLTLEGAE